MIYYFITKPKAQLDVFKGIMEKLSQLHK